MTNEQIIMGQRIELLKAGIIGSTGRILTVVSVDGTKSEMEEPEEIHTYQGWRSYGYQVRKGEKAVAKFPVWKHRKDKMENDGKTEEVEKMFLTNAAFFKISQVERMKENAG